MSTAVPTELRSRRAPRIVEEIRVPGDKSISHRSVILASLANGPCVIRGFLPSEDCLCTMQAMIALGVRIERPEPTTLIVHGNKGNFTPPSAPIDCGNSGTAMRLLAGILAACPFESTLIGDASLSGRPMKRIIEPLAAMGARITAQGEKPGSAPLHIHGGPLSPITYRLPVASAQVKSAILLAGLRAPGKTTVIEPLRSRDHTERMLEYFLISLQRESELSIALHGGQTLESRDFTVPGDISSAAFWLVAAAAQPGAHLIVKGVGLNETRTGILDVLIRMGAHVREIVETTDGERSGTIEIKGTELVGTAICGREIPNVIDEIPIIAVAGALAKGKTVIKDAQELRVKESDRIASVVHHLRAMGVDVKETDDGMEIEGGRPLKAARLPSYGDHRIAMAFAIAGLFAEGGDTVLEDTACVATSYPGFHSVLDLVQKARHLPGEHTPVIDSLKGMTPPHRPPDQRNVGLGA